MVSRKMVRTVIGIVVLVTIGALGWFFLSRMNAGPRLSNEAAARAVERNQYLPVLVLLEPGTVVDSGPPDGWSHSVVKSETFIAGGDVATLPAFAIRSATKFRTVVLADVERDPVHGQYYLSRVGAGLGTPHHDRDTIISYDTLGTLGIELSTLDGLVLNRAEKALGRSRLAARTSTFALYDTFVELADSTGKHNSIMLRYAMLVDPQTGTLRTAVWHVAEKSEARSEVESLSLLPNGYVFRCGIHVAARRVIGNLASSWGFAMMDLPSGQTIPMSEELKRIANLNPGEIDPNAMEAAVRENLGNRPSPPAIKPASKNLDKP